MDDVRYIKDGEPVNAGVANRPSRDLAGQLNYVRGVLDATAAGSAVFARSVAISPELQPGSPAYFNSDTERFEPALFRVTSDDSRLVASPSSQVWGVLASKQSAGVGDLALAGRITLDLQSSLEPGETLQPGEYRLSGTWAGRLTRRNTPGPVVLRYTAGAAFICPQISSAHLEHVHHRFELTALPAGDHTPPSPGQPHTIDNPDPQLPGWLPADHPVFDGKQPDGAVFGYNLAADPQLQAAWPPVPEQAYIEIVRNGQATGSSVPLGPDGLAYIDRHGIWWMSDCAGSAPWPADLDTQSGDSDSDSDTGNCPWASQRMSLTLWFGRPAWLTRLTAVTSLASDDPRIEITCGDSEGATGATGDLRLRLNLDLGYGDDADELPVAVKSLDDATNLLHRGPVMTGVYAASEDIGLISPYQRTLEIQGQPKTVYYGPVGIGMQSDLDRELFVSLVRLDGAEEEFVLDTPYIAFRADQPSGFRGRLHVPSTLTLSNPTVSLRFRFIGRVSGTTPGLTLTVRRVASPGGVSALPTTDSPVSLNTATAVATPNSYFDVQSAAVAVEPGDDLFFTLSRNGNDGYAGVMGVMRQSGIVAAG